MRIERLVMRVEPTSAQTTRVQATVPFDGFILWADMFSGTLVEQDFTGIQYSWCSLSVSSVYNDAGEIVRNGFGAARKAGTDPYGPGMSANSKFCNGLFIPLKAGQILYLHGESSAGIAGTHRVTVGFADSLFFLTRNSGHVTQLRTPKRSVDPGASSGDLPTVIDFKKLSSRVCTLAEARKVVVAAVQATLLGAGTIVDNAYIFQAQGGADILQAILEGKAALPVFEASTLVSLLQDWVFEGFDKLKARASSVLIDAPAIQQNIQGLYISPYEEALRLLFEAALSQSKPRVWISEHHRKRIE